MSNMSFTKRQKERQRKEKQQEKEIKRTEKRKENATRPKGQGAEMDFNAVREMGGFPANMGPMEPEPSPEDAEEARVAARKADEEAPR